jgi:hypothetical protein
MSVIQQVQKRMLISLAQVSKAANIREGDHVSLEVREGGVFIRPVSWHDKNQEYFWSDEWQTKMRLSADAIAKGKVKIFGDAESLLKELGEADADDHSN